MPQPLRAEAETATDLAEFLPREAFDLAAIDAELELRRVRGSFADFFRYMDPSAIDGWWQRDACARLQRFHEQLARGERPQLAICSPPQHGKTRLIVDFLAWLAGRSPNEKMIYASFSDRLGVRANLRLQRILDSPRYRALFPEARLHDANNVTQTAKPRRNSELLEFVGQQGYFRNTTVRGSITGESLDLGVIDDPIKGREEAESEAIRNKTWEWLQDDFLSRFSEDAGLLIIMTRWHLDDPLGRLERESDRLEVVRYRAIAEEDEPFRKAGDPLFPEFKSLRFLEGRRAIMHPASWLSLYQQRPVPREGGIVKEAWLTTRWRVRGEKPLRLIASMDCASKAKHRNDPSAVLVAAEFADRIELWDYDARRVEFPELKRWARDVHAKWKLTHFLVEDKDAGQQLLQDLRRETKIPVVPSTPSTDKETRLMAETGILQAGKVWLPDAAPWVSDWVAELTTFPQATHDESADTLSQLLRWVRENPQRRFVGIAGVAKESNRLGGFG